MDELEKNEELVSEETEVIEIESDRSENPFTHSPTFEETEKLVKERIKWFRKWTKNDPNYLHSFHVRDILKENRFDETVQMAGLLHDIIEDWETSFDELKKLWYSDEVIRLVDLATHDVENKDTLQRRKDMMKRLEDACDKNARAVKLADICDNVNGCHTMPKLERKRRFLYKKCPYFVEQWNKWFWGTEFYLEFLRRYHKQLYRLVEFEKRRAAWRVIWFVAWLAFLWAVWFTWYEYYINNESLMMLWAGITLWIGMVMIILRIVSLCVPYKNID